MKRLLLTVAIISACTSVVIWAQQPVKVVDASGTLVPLSTTTEIAHGASAPTWTSVIGGVTMRRASSTVPSAVATDQPVAPWSGLTGAEAIFPTAYNVGGCIPGKLVSGASTNSTLIIGAVAQLYTMTASNTNAAVRYLKVYDKATAPTVGSDTPKQTIALPPSGATAPQLGTAIGQSYSAGIGFALTTGAADSDTGAVAASEILVNYCYKS